tara:strand:+ start:3646 stop:5328 length:1683 start_codon:yes stop_codon:yes gene_type:complete
MYKLLFLLIPFFLVCQNSTQLELSQEIRSVPKTGLNGNTIRGPSWINVTFNDSVQTMYPKLLRYPGGNVSNYWNWSEGWFYDQSVLDTVLLPDTIYTLTPSFQSIYNSPIDISPNRFQGALDQINSKGIYVLNMMSASLSKQMDDLRNAIDSGIVIRRIELGSEFNHNNPFSAIRFPTAGDYARECNIWIDSIKTLIPDVQIGLVAGNRGPDFTRAWRWNDSICSIVSNADALIWHLYLYLYDSDTTFTDKKITAYPFYRVPLYEKWRGFRDTTMMIQNYDLWVTEYNLFDKTSDKRFTNTWAHVLILAGMNHNLLKNNLVDIMIKHNVGGIFSNFDALDTQNNFRKRSSGYSASIWNSLMWNMSYAQKINVNSSILDSVEYTNSNGVVNEVLFPKLYGWKFSSVDQERSILVNISGDSILVDASLIVSENANWVHWTSDSLFAQIGDNSYIKHDTILGNQNITIPPYSISSISNQCFNDLDMDLICDEIDNCINTYNPNQYDFDNDGIGDECDGIGLDPSTKSKLLISITNLLGRDDNNKDYEIKIFDDGTVLKKYFIK